MPHMPMNHDVDPKDELLKALGDLSKIELFNNTILLAVYIRPQRTKSGLYLSDKTLDEDRYQSKVGLLVAAGPTSFTDPDGNWFAGAGIKLHDWLAYRPSDGWNVTVNGVLCRMMVDTQIRMRISHPDEVY
jgi:hypothetical protein